MLHCTMVLTMHTMHPGQSALHPAHNEQEQQAPHHLPSPPVMWTIPAGGCVWVCHSQVQGAIHRVLQCVTAQVHGGNNEEKHICPLRYGEVPANQGGTANTSMREFGACAVGTSLSYKHLNANTQEQDIKKEWMGNVSYFSSIHANTYTLTYPVSIM